MGVKIWMCKNSAYNKFNGFLLAYKQISYFLLVHEQLDNHLHDGSIKITIEII